MNTSRWRAPLALIVLAVLFACLKGTTPTDASASNVRFDLKAQVTGGSTLHVTVVYLDQKANSETPTPVMLLDRRITVAAGTQDLPLTIDVTRCLADPQHITGSTCELLAGIVLEQNGQEVDSVGVGPITVTPGQTVHDSTSLVAVGQVVVFPKTASLTIGAITVISDSVFSPSGAYIPNATVSWTSADTTIAKVNKNGAVTGVAAGTTTVTASAGGASDFATITVQGSQPNNGLTFPGLSSVGNTVTFSAVIGANLPVDAYVPVQSTDTTTVGDLTIAITPSSSSQWLEGYVSDSGFGSHVKHRPPGFTVKQIRKQSSGSGVTTPATVHLHPLTTNLAAGTYNATVTISGDGGRSASFQVTYTLTAAAPALGFSPNPILFTQYAFSAAVASEATAYAENVGTGGSLGTISESGDITYSGVQGGWLNVLGIGPDTVALQPHTTDLNLGIDTARMVFTMTGATNPDTLVAEVYSTVTYQKVVLGAAFGCGLTTASTVYCWGGTGQGELGDGGTDLGVQTPVQANIPSGNTVVDIEAGSYHACALTSIGSVYCWGQNTYGQVGVGSAASTVGTPTLIPGKTYGQITLGAYHTCAIEGTPPLAGANYVDCWGNNQYGEFGNNTTTTAAQTTPLVTPNIMVSVSAGNGYTCAINNVVIGYLYCWGINGSGQLGNGYSGGIYPSPQQVNVLNPSTGGLAVVSSVTTGNGTTCAVDNAGNGSCWGDNTYGEVGNGNTTTPVLNPTLIPGGYSWTSISAGYTSVCGIASTGDFCWGYDNYGQLGNGTIENASSSSPQAIAGASGLFTELTVGQASQSGCYISSNTVLCFGWDSNGQLGTGGPIPNGTGTPVAMTAQPGPTYYAPSRVKRRPVVVKRSSH